jgi:hypothetical protein
MAREKFDAIFRDAPVIDVDLSQRDSRIRVVIGALEEANVPEGRLSIYAGTSSKYRSCTVGSNSGTLPRSFPQRALPMECLRGLRF